MFAEKTELHLVEDLNENAIAELNAADVDEVSGGFLPVIVMVAGLGVGAAAGYLINR